MALASVFDATTGSVSPARLSWAMRAATKAFLAASSSSAPFAAPVPSFASFTVDWNLAAFSTGLASQSSGLFAGGGAPAAGSDAGVGAGGIDMVDALTSACAQSNMACRVDEEAALRVCEVLRQ